MRFEVVTMVALRTRLAAGETLQFGRKQRLFPVFSTACEDSACLRTVGTRVPKPRGSAAHKTLI